MSDLVVDATLLSQCSRQLNQIDAEFKGTSAHQRALSDDWGSSDIASSMDGFANNWSYHRKQLISSIESVGKMVDACNQAFSSTDEKLAGALTQHKK